MGGTEDTLPWGHGPSPQTALPVCDATGCSDLSAAYVYCGSRCFFAASDTCRWFPLGCRAAGRTLRQRRTSLGAPHSGVCTTGPRHHTHWEGWVSFHSNVSVEKQCRYREAAPWIENPQPSLSLCHPGRPAAQSPSGCIPRVRGTAASGRRVLVPSAMLQARANITLGRHFRALSAGIRKKGLDARFCCRPAAIGHAAMRCCSRLH